MRVTAGGAAYDVVVGTGVIAEAASHLPELPRAEMAFVVADRQVADRWFDTLTHGFAPRSLRTVLLEIPPGEEAKSLLVYESLLHRMAGEEAHRDDVVVSLGGGAAGDLAGFVASTYMRGVPFIQVPTTLTAQVDAAVGGKTAINLPSGKNLAGTFYHPIAVLCDVTPLASLSDRDYRSGLAEVAKYALALDVGLLEELEGDLAPILAREPDTLERLVARCLKIKADAVAADERDRGQRLFLNYGHTLGHTLERLAGFEGRTHGEAIALGMTFAARLAEASGVASSVGLSTRTEHLLKALGLDPNGTLPPIDQIMSALRMDKKWATGLRFVLLEEIGRPIVVDDVPTDLVEQTLRSMGAPE